jgi:hypothetical protein
MSLIFATIVAVMTTATLFVLGVMLVMIAQRNPALAAQLRDAQGSVDNIRRGQMKAPDSVPRHWVGGGMAWNDITKTHERQSAVSLEALKGVFIVK